MSALTVNQFWGNMVFGAEYSLNLWRHVTAPKAGEAEFLYQKQSRVRGASVNVQGFGLKADAPFHREVIHPRTLVSLNKKRASGNHLPVEAIMAKDKKNPLKNLIHDIAGQIGVRLALAAHTPSARKKRLTKLYELGIIRPSLLQWAISVNGLKGE